MTVSSETVSVQSDPDVPAALAGRAHRATESLHALIYFAPEAQSALASSGLKPGRMAYFASRSAPMGAVGPGVVTATFYNFSHDLTAHFIPLAWEMASPDAVVAARWDAADASLRAVLGNDVLAAPETAELIELLTAAAAGCTREGRALYAGHADLTPPDDASTAVRLWWAVTLLREFRGDGHLMALAQAGLSGIEAIVSHTATGRGFTVAAAKSLRGWDDAQWAAAEDALRRRDLVDDAGVLTEPGARLREDIENETDQLALAPWQTIGAEATERVITLGKPLVRRVVASGVFGTETFQAPRA